MKPLVALRSVREEVDSPEPSPPPPMDIPPTTERHSYEPAAGSRWVGLGGTLLIYALVLAGFLITISHVVPVQAPPPALSVFDVNPPATPPEKPLEEKEAPKPVKEKKDHPEPPRVQPVERNIVPIAQVSVPMPVVQPKPADLGPKEAKAAAPEAQPASIAPRVSSNDPDTWEGRVLAALYRLRRYPRIAMARRQQGVPYIRFVINREGKVLSSRLERSTGFSELDREAVALAKRASPLPKPPDDKPGDTLELVVPVEFFLK